jgi:5'(3')-deoxyribonucleotidase
MSERRQRIAVDMDDVIADTIERFAEIYRQKHNIDLNPKILHGKEIREVLPAGYQAHCF